MTIQRERLVAAAAGRPSARRRVGACAPQDLRGESFVILARREAPGLYAGLAAAMGDAGGLPDDVLEVAEMQTIISLVAGRLRRLARAGVGRPGRPQRRRVPADRRADADDRARGRLARAAPARRCATSSSRSRGRARRAAAHHRSRPTSDGPLNVQGPRGCEERFTGALHGEERKAQATTPVPWYVQYSFFLAVSRFAPVTIATAHA